MNEKLRDYLEKKQEEIAKKKGHKLIELGLFEKVYEGEEGYNPEEACYEWNDETQEGTYYSKNPIEVTDEEYEEIIKVSQQDTSIQKKENTIASLLKVIAWIIYIGGFILGLVLSSNTGYARDEINFVSALVYWAVAFVNGTLLLGFAEIIKLLNDIKHKL